MNGNPMVSGKYNHVISAFMAKIKENLKIKFGRGTLHREAVSEFLNPIEESIVVVESTLPENGKSKSIPLPAGFNNDSFVVGVKYQNINNVWLDLSGDHTVDFGIKASILNNALYLYNNVAWANGKRAKIMLMRTMV